MKLLRHTCFVPILLLLTSGDVLAQSNIDTRVQKLEETILALERRIAALEGDIHNQKVATTVSPSVANWRKLQKGMSRSDVEQLLGSPTKVTVYGSFTVWFYETSSGLGRVNFDGRTQAVERWSEP